nr:MAG TPA: hypothetical protein [Caudoviricetes sp.]DAR60242.1 MAG TPA: hypothetical protein [Caudoviricetes sp.]
MWNKTDSSLALQAVEYVPSPHSYIRTWIVQRA